MLPLAIPIAMTLFDIGSELYNSMKEKKEVVPQKEVMPAEALEYDCGKIASPQVVRACYISDDAYVFDFAFRKYEPNMCTHIIYGSYVIDESGEITLSSESEFILRELLTLKEMQPNLKILLSFGGYEFFAKNASIVQALRKTTVLKKFIMSSVDLLKDSGIDGLDLDWRYPKKEDKFFFGRLTRALRSAMDVAEDLNKQQYVLSATAAPLPLSESNSGYDVVVMNEQLHFVNLLTFDFHGQWENKLGHGAPLYCETETDVACITKSVEVWLKRGLCPQKMVLGLAGYARGWKISNARNSDVGQAVPPNKDSKGTSPYWDLCLQSRHQSFDKTYDPIQSSVVFALNDYWYSMEDAQSLMVKARYAKSHGLAGVFFYQMEYDDAEGKCSWNQNRTFPLIRVMKEVFDDIPPRSKNDDDDDER